jgi:hypothetical protein
VPRPQNSTGTGGLSRVGQGLKPVAAPAPKGIYGGQLEGVAVIGRVHRFMGAVQAKGHSEGARGAGRGHSEMLTNTRPRGSAVLGLHLEGAVARQSALSTLNR